MKIKRVLGRRETRSGSHNVNPFLPPPLPPPIFSNGLIIFEGCTSSGHSRAISFSIIPSDCKSPRHYRYRKAGSLINHAPENPVFLRRQVEIADEIFMRALNSWFCAFLNEMRSLNTRRRDSGGKTPDARDLSSFTFVFIFAFARSFLFVSFNWILMQLYRSIIPRFLFPRTRAS